MAGGWTISRLMSPAPDKKPARQLQALAERHSYRKALLNDLQLGGWRILIFKVCGQRSWVGLERAGTHPATMQTEIP